MLMIHTQVGAQVMLAHFSLMATEDTCIYTQTDTHKYLYSAPTTVATGLHKKYLRVSRRHPQRSSRLEMRGAWGDARAPIRYTLHTTALKHILNQILYVVLMA